MHPNEEQAPPLAPLASPPPPKRGDPCPNCQQGRLDYNGVLNLECPLCGYSAGGGGCT